MGITQRMLSPVNVLFIVTVQSRCIESFQDEIEGGLLAKDHSRKENIVLNETLK